MDRELEQFLVENKFGDFVNVFYQVGVVSLADLVPLCSASAEDIRYFASLGLDNVAAYRLIAAVRRTGAVPPPAAPARGNMDQETQQFLRDNRLTHTYTARFEELGVSCMGDLEALCTSATALEDLQSQAGLKRLQARTLIGSMSKAVADRFQEEYVDAQVSQQEARHAAESARAELEFRKKEAARTAKEDAAEAAKVEKLRLKVEVARKKAEDKLAIEAEQDAWYEEMKLQRVGKGDVNLEGMMEVASGLGVFKREKWAPRYCVFDSSTGVLDLYVQYGGLVCSFVVTTGSAVNKGKAGPLGRRFRVEVTTCDPEDESDEAISAFLCYSPDDAEVWSSVFNGAEVPDEYKKEEPPPGPVVTPKTAPRYLSVNPFKQKDVMDSNVNTVGSLGFSRFKPVPKGTGGSKVARKAIGEKRNPMLPGSPRAKKPTASNRNSRDEDMLDEGEEEEEVDLDGDGKKKKKKQLTISELFDVIDTNGDGSLDLEEVVAASDTLGMTEEEAYKMFNDLDKTGKGTLDRADFDGIHAKFKKLTELWSSPEVKAPKLTAKAAKAKSRLFDTNVYKVKGSDVLEEKEVVLPSSGGKTKKADAASPRYLNTNNFKVKGAAVLEIPDVELPAPKLSAKSDGAVPRYLQANPFKHKGAQKANGKMDRAKTIKIGEVFDLIDVNGDGVLDIDEILAYADKLGMSHKDAMKMFRELDKDGSGTLERSEFEGAESAFFAAPTLDVKVKATKSEKFSGGSSDIKHENFDIKKFETPSSPTSNDGDAEGGGGAPSSPPSSSVKSKTAAAAAGGGGGIDYSTWLGDDSDEEEGEEEGEEETKQEKQPPKQMSAKEIKALEKKEKAEAIARAKQQKAGGGGGEEPTKKRTSIFW